MNVLPGPSIDDYRAKVRWRVRATAIGAAVVTTFGVMAGVMAQPAAAVSPQTATVAPDSAFTLDGALDGGYSTFGSTSIQLTTADTRPRSFYSTISVAQTDNYWYVYMQQPTNVKTATYCATKTKTGPCYQTWNDLVGSDFFELEFVAGGVTRTLHADALYWGTSAHAASTTWTSGFGTGCKECSLAGVTSSQVDAATTYDYNYNVVGYHDTANSPAPGTVPGYIYESAAEFRIAKSALPAGFSFDPATASYSVHDSPAAPTSTVLHDRYVNLDCTTVPTTVAIGTKVSVPVSATDNGSPASGATIQGALSPTGIAGLDTNPVTTGSAGTASFSVTATAAGTTKLTAFWDLNGNGVQDLGTSTSPAEPVAPQVCTITVVAPAQTVAGQIKVCSSNANVSGGQMSITPATDPNTIIASGPSPVAPASVAAGSYVGHGISPPTGYQFTDCNGTNPDATTSTAVAVPANGTGTVILYVTPLTQPPAQTVSGVIKVCSTNTAITGGAMTITLSGSTTIVASGASPLAPTSVDAGDYVGHGVTPPAGYQFTDCNGANPNATTSTAVTVPTNGTGTVILYVNPVTPPPSQTVSGLIRICSTGTAVLGGQMTITPAGSATIVASGPSPVAPVAVDAGDYVGHGITPPAGYQFTDCNGANPSATTSTTVTVVSGGSSTVTLYVNPVTPPPSQTVSGLIRNCSTGTTVPGGSMTITPAGSATDVASGASPLAPTSVDAGSYVGHGVTPPSGYEFTDCGGTNPSATTSTAVSVPTGGTNTVVLYVNPVNVPNPQTVSGLIQTCDTKALVAGGSITITPLGSATTVASGTSPLGPVSVAAGNYVVHGLTPPAGYQFTDCAGLNPNATTSTTVNVPSGGSGTGILYVTPTTPPPTQTVSGLIQTCDTKALVAGGSITITPLGSASTVASGASPLGPVSVAAGNYVVHGLTPPAGYQFTDCAGLNPNATTSTTVNVPTSGSGTGILYVTPVTPPPTQEVSGVIQLCSTHAIVSGGSLTITPAGSSSTLASGTSPLGPVSVAAGNYVVHGVAPPAGYQFTDCGINPDATTSTTVNVPTGGSGIGIVYVNPVTPPPVQSVAGVIRVCSTGTILAGGSLTITPAGSNTVITSGASPLGPVSVAAGNYVVHGVTAPTGYQFTDCGGTNPNATTSQTVNVPTGGSGVGTLYVTLIAPPTPNVHVAKTGPATGLLGGTGSYTIVATNTGGAPSAATTFTDTLPAGETFVPAGSSLDCSANGRVVTCQLGPLAANGGSQSFTVVVSYSATGNLTDCATIDGQLSPSCVTTHVGAPNVSVVKSGPATGVLGGKGSYQLLATNTGDAASAPTTITDTLPAGETFVAAGSSAACSASGQTVTCQLGALDAAGGTHDSASFTVVVQYAATGDLTDCATVPGQANSSCVTTHVPVTPTLSVVKTNDGNGDGNFTDSEVAPNAGGDVAFKVIVTNTSTEDITIDSVIDAYAATATGVCDSLLGKVLAAGASLTCTFTIPGYAPAAGASLTDTVTVTGHDPNGTSVTAHDTSTVTTAKPPTPGSPDLAIVKTAAPGSVTVTTTQQPTLTYTLTVSNVGSAATSAPVTVTDTLPTGLSLLTIDGGTAWSCNASGLAITCTYLDGAIQPGQTVATITVTVQVLTTAPTVLVNTGVVHTLGDQNPANDASTVKTPVTKVFGEKIVNPSTPSIPFTGSYALQMVPVGLFALLFGAVLLIVGRRQRSGRRTTNT